ncbi:hypothetical protein [Halopelagius longus]|uniref:DUF8108 domain-containing protein n=1 Tax=Halopelagius longus TaxID=1236180 RepID=A0A1H1EE58_9EURY|nr:hypothetical protein [Halopelagius longus]RDI71716.1 hypothetical protein DWB78_08240 [Halopelagius longus]SDQ86924.1 hypothetical protein SAMN05216278_2859 [Halopelagius longus]
MRLARELAAAVALLVAVGALARTPAGRFVLPAVSVAVAVTLAWTLTRPAAYPRTAVGVRTRVVESPADGRDDSPPCVECGSPATTRRRYVREGVVLGVPLVLLDDGENDYCGDCLALASRD